jgi:hypothetical protein
MMKFSTIVIAIAILLATGRCAWLDKKESVKITGDFEVGWNDIESNRAIVKPSKACGEGCYDIIVDSYVYSVGHNNRFICAKQHPDLDTARTKYFLIDISKNDKDAKKGIYGPLEKEEFEKMLVKLEVTDLKFDLNFSERVW